MVNKRKKMVRALKFRMKFLSFDHIDSQNSIRLSNNHQVFHYEIVPELIEGKFSITILFPYVNKY